MSKQKVENQDKEIEKIFETCRDSLFKLEGVGGFYFYFEGNGKQHTVSNLNNKGLRGLKTNINFRINKSKKK